ncbi:MAG TPA: RNA methyltransferase [Nitrospirae bacterium]|nr:RNA methyltransferase [Nitrospirota bacterium]
MSGVNEIKKITSPQNSLIKETARLLKKRQKSGEFLIEGINLLEAALRPGSNAKVSKLFYTQEFVAREQEVFGVFIKEASSNGAEIFELSTGAIERISDTSTPQGIAAVATLEPSSLFSIDPAKGPIVVADGIQDPGNLGTIIRTADAASAAGVLLIDGITCDPLNPKALRASAGSVFNFPVISEKKEIAIAGLRSLGCTIAVSVPGGKTHYYDSPLSLPLAIVFGNEARGVSDEFMEAADVSVSIPVKGGAESLSVSAAAAVLLYEALRQGVTGGH